MPSMNPLSPLDASFLELESETAHMHVGWAATFKPPAEGPRPGFEELREHIAERLPRAPRYRQRLKQVPLKLLPPSWVDDEGFDVGHHVIPARSERLSEVVEDCMSEPLPRDRPLWQICVADRLEDGRIGVVGKAHHSMVDGIAAVELVSLLLDSEPDAPPPEPDSWKPAPEPPGGELLARGAVDRVAEQLRFATGPLRAVASPDRLAGLAHRAGSAARALADVARPATPSGSLNGPISPNRRLGTTRRPLDQLKRIRSSFGATVNDVVLAVTAGAMRRYLESRDDDPAPLKAMVPVDLRAEGEGGELGNRISFVFCDLPCEEPDATRRLQRCQEQAVVWKRAEQPQGGGALLDLVGHVAYPLHRFASRHVASPRTFNLVVSNIPGPPEKMYMRGCPLDEAYPVVPAPDEHALSIGMTTVGGDAFFGLYADSEQLPDIDRLADEIEGEIDRFLELAGEREQAASPAGV